MKVALNTLHDVNCPHCGNDFCAPVRTEVFSREEDAPRGIVVGVCMGYTDRHSVTVNTHGRMDSNPSQRRSGVRIVFDCENCGAAFSWTFASHKGQTHLSSALHGDVAKVV